MPGRPDYELLAADDCAVCGRAGSVVQPDYCSEGHGLDCPDRICLDCGSALFIGPATVDPARPDAVLPPAQTA